MQTNTKQSTADHQILLSLTTHSPSTCCVICKHLLKILLQKVHVTPETTRKVTPYNISNFYSIIELQQGPAQIQMINRLQISPSCSCLQKDSIHRYNDPQNNIFYVSCNLSVYRMFKGEKKEQILPQVTSIKIRDIRIASPGGEVKKLKISITTPNSPLLRVTADSIRPIIRNLVVLENSQVYDPFNPDRFIQIKEIFADSRISTSTQAFEDDIIFHISKRTYIEIIQETETGRQQEHKITANTNLLSRSPSQGKNTRQLASDKEFSFLNDLVKLSIEWPNRFSDSLFSPPCGVLLKTKSVGDASQIIQSLVEQHKACFSSFQWSDALSLFVGDTEASLRSVFTKASVSHSQYPISIIYIESIEKICGKRSEQRSTSQNRLVGQLLTLMDGIQSKSSAGFLRDVHGGVRAPILVIASTEEPKLIDQALRRSGRFDYELWIGVEQGGNLSEKERFRFLSHSLSQFPLHHSFSDKFESFLEHELIDASVAFSFSDLELLCKEILICYLHRIKQKNNQNTESRTEELQIGIIAEDIRDALLVVRPSRPISSHNTKIISWEDIGGLYETKKLLQRVIEWPLRYSAQFLRMNLKSPTGILLYGPPGCCKTTLVRAAAYSSQASFLSMNGAEIYSPYFGASENFIREKFKQARALQPCLLFIDEIDAVVGKRTEDGGSDSHGIQQRILSTLLNELDGVGTLDGECEPSKVILVAATNRIDMIDSALLRPGRLDQLIFVPKPSNEELELIFAVKTAKLPLAEDVDIKYLSSICTGFTGAEIENLCREAALGALKENIHSSSIEFKHFLSAAASCKIT